MPLLLNCLYQLLFVHCTRWIVHDLGRCKDGNTAGRVSSLVQGLLCALSLWRGKTELALLETGSYFVYDFFAAKWIFKKSMPREMVVHHIAGAALCYATLWCGGYVQGHAAHDLTLSLLKMELTNPLFQLIMILRAEDIEAWKDATIKWTLSACLIASWVYFRIYAIAVAIYGACSVWHDPKTDSRTAIGIGLGSVLLVQQIVWLGALIRKAKTA